ncbi:Uncharacterised protein [Legionella cincinnatiensis]|uniref:Uncharacterized protein n=1 Tax=Legionella cincinnatiensis TaxID=28085 RepID=A0A378ILK7_9GAMM|nr:Uncharacterised protein [Legionella cincinnatiensis]
MKFKEILKILQKEIVLYHAQDFSNCSKLYLPNSWEQLI